MVGSGTFGDLGYFVLAVDLTRAIEIVFQRREGYILID
jgi:hypothetical protein